MFKLNKNNSLEILLDFDGTITTHEFPKIGKDVGAVPILKALVENGHKLILFTMRSDRLEKKDTGDPTILDVTGNFLTDAVNWFKEKEIPLYGIQTNPTQHHWTTSPKAYGQLIIDDTCLGIPLIEIIDMRPFVDWVGVGKLLHEKGLISEQQLINSVPKIFQETRVFEN